MALTRNRLIGNLANATDSAASSSFLAKGAEEANYQSIAYSDVTGKPTILDSAGITSIIDSAYVLARQGSAVAGLDSAGITSLIDSNYVVARAAASGSGYGRYNYTATAGQTVFQDSDNSGAILSYTSGGIMVFYNGVMLKNTADWEGTDGSSVTLVEAADSGANVSIHKWTVAGGGSGGAAATWYGDRALAMGGYTTGYSTGIDYWSVATPGNASDFGDITAARFGGAGMSDGTYGVMAIGREDGVDSTVIDYVTIATTSNATDFGDGTAGYMCSGIGDGTYGVYHKGTADTDGLEYITITSPGNGTTFGNLTTTAFGMAATGDGTYGLWAGGSNANAISYVTLASAGNGSSFGNLSTTNRYNPGAGSDTTRGVFCGGYNGSSSVNVIDYVTIASPSNATDFGDLTRSHNRITDNTGDGTYATFAGGVTGGSLIGNNNIDYITIQTTGNATDFGDMVAANAHPTGCAGSSS